MARRCWSLLLFVAAGCADTWEPMAPSQVCDDVGFAIASRTMECTGDAALAAARSEAFDQAYRCRVQGLEEPIDRYYHCPVSVYGLSCADVEAFGDDLSAWLTASSVCGVILDRSESGA